MTGNQEIEDLRQKVRQLEQENQTLKKQLELAEDSSSLMSEAYGGLKDGTNSLLNNFEQTLTKTLLKLQEFRDVELSDS